MFTKTIITLCAALTLATSLVSVADAQSGQPMPSFSAGERLWFSIPEGREDHLPR